MKNAVTKEQLKAALDLVRIVAEAIREASQLPAGELYAVMMGTVSLPEFDRVIGMLVNAGLVAREQSNLLRWIGGAK